MIKARPKYPTDMYGTIYTDNIQKAVVICLIMPTTFPYDSGSRVDNVRHTSRYFFYAGSTFNEFDRKRCMGHVHEDNTSDHPPFFYMSV